MSRRNRRLLLFGGLLALTAYNLHCLVQSYQSGEPPSLNLERKLVSGLAVESDTQSGSGSTAGSSVQKQAGGGGGAEGVETTGASATANENGGGGERRCHSEEQTEFDGAVVTWGGNNLQESAAACCESCRIKMGCGIWVWCGHSEGCTAERRHKECWLKGLSTSVDVRRPNGNRGGGIKWTSGILYTDNEAAAAVSRFDAREAKDVARLAALRANLSLPLVFLDVEIKGKPMGRMEFVLFTDVSPRSAENFRQLCTGEAGVVPRDGAEKREGAGLPYHFKGCFFYRIIDRFIDQSGTNVESVFGGQFKDDKDGLKLQHDRKGLLSMANMGPDTNTAHFSIMQAPAHHLDTHYTIFGELVSGWHAAEAINALSRGKKDNTANQADGAKIADSGQIRKGTLVPDLRKP